MANICDITGKGVVTGNLVSKANNKTSRRFYPNLQRKSFFFPELGAWVMLKVCTKAMRTINKYGLYYTLKKALKRGTLSPKVVRVMKNVS